MTVSPNTGDNPATQTNMKENNKQQIFEESYTKLLYTLDDKVTFSNMVNLITSSIEIVDKYKKLSGLEKKLMVVKMITTLIDKHEYDESVKKALIDLLNTVGLSVIDTIIYATKGKLAINLTKCRKLIKYFKCL
tara:strand:+ start:2923 stop:3324 length:402 start_codon:yes stop_codon:yes gene_type:complete